MARPSRARVGGQFDAGVGPDFALVVAAFAEGPDVTRGRMMGASVLKVGGKIFAMEVKGELVVKLPKARVDGLVGGGVGRHFDPGHGRPMKEWAVVDADGADWIGLALEAYRFLKGLSQ